MKTNFPDRDCETAECIDKPTAALLNARAPTTSITDGGKS